MSSTLPTGQANGRHGISDTARLLLLAFIGAAALLVLQCHFARAWVGYYSRFPWRGYEQAMRQGHVPAFLTTSPRSLRVGSCVLFALPLLTFRLNGGRPLRSSLALWAGVMVALVAVWVATPQLRQDSNLWPIDLVLLLCPTGLPLLTGAVTLRLLTAALNGFLFGKAV